MKSKRLFELDWKLFSDGVSTGGWENDEYRMLVCDEEFRKQFLDLLFELPDGVKEITVYFSSVPSVNRWPCKVLKTSKACSFPHIEIKDYCIIFEEYETDELFESIAKQLGNKTVYVGVDWE